MAKCCATKTSVLAAAARVTMGCTGTPAPNSILVGCNIIPICLVVGYGSVLKHPGSLSRVCTGPIVNIVRWKSHLFSITNLIILISGCMCAGTPGHIPKHMGQMSNNSIIIWFQLLALYWFHVTLLFHVLVLPLHGCTRMFDMNIPVSLTLIWHSCYLDIEERHVHVELSATRRKVSHHTRGGGHLLVYVGATSRLHIVSSVDLL